MEFCCHNLIKRKILLVYNTDGAELTKILRDNIVNKTLETKELNTIKNNNNLLLLLINIYLKDNKSNILIFIEEEKALVIPTKEEKIFFKKYYWSIYNNLYYENKILKIAEEYKQKIEKKK